MGQERLQSGESIPPELSFFFVRVKAAFDSNHSFLGFFDAAVAVLGQMSDQEISVLGIVFDKNQHAGFEKSQASLLKSFQESMPEKKWIRFEMESARRHLQDDHYYGSTPG